MFPKLNCSPPQVINSYSFVMKCYWLLLQDVNYMGCYGEHFEVHMALKCLFISKELRLHDASCMVYQECDYELLYMCPTHNYNDNMSEYTGRV